jgi:ActR/RegA family two-component response regulator
VTSEVVAMEKRINLLIVDDEVAFLKAIARRLEMRGFRREASDGGPTLGRRSRTP